MLLAAQGLLAAEYGQESIRESFRPLACPAGALIAAGGFPRVRFYADNPIHNRKRREHINEAVKHPAGNCGYSSTPINSKNSKTPNFVRGELASHRFALHRCLYPGDARNGNAMVDCKQLGRS